MSAEDELTRKIPFFAQDLARSLMMENGPMLAPPSSGIHAVIPPPLRIRRPVKTAEANANDEALTSGDIDATTAKVPEYVRRLAESLMDGKTIDDSITDADIPVAVETAPIATSSAAPAPARGHGIANVVRTGAWATIALAAVALVGLEASRLSSTGERAPHQYVPTPVHACIADMPARSVLQSVTAPTIHRVAKPALMASRPTLRPARAGGKSASTVGKPGALVRVSPF
jgi:hypothetical protein